MKYGYHDDAWRDEIRPNDNFCSKVILFNIDCFQPTMRRKTWSEIDEHYLKCLTEMVAMLNEKAESFRNK